MAGDRHNAAVVVAPGGGPRTLYATAVLYARDWSHGGDGPDRRLRVWSEVVAGEYPVADPVADPEAARRADAAIRGHEPDLREFRTDRASVNATVIAAST